MRALDSLEEARNLRNKPLTVRPLCAVAGRCGRGPCRNNDHPQDHDGGARTGLMTKRRRSTRWPSLVYPEERRAGAHPSWMNFLRKRALTNPAAECRSCSSNVETAPAGNRSRPGLLMARQGGMFVAGLSHRLGAIALSRFDDINRSATLYGVALSFCRNLALIDEAAAEACWYDLACCPPVGLCR